MKLVIALVLVFGAVAGGAALGLALRPEPPAAVATRAVPDTAPSPNADPAYVKIARQIIVPVVEGGQTRALMVFEIALDVPPSRRDLVFEREPRLRDAFLRELFEMSHTGMFLESYTEPRAMEELRDKLLAAARLHLGAWVSDVLILDALRQEL